MFQLTGEGICGRRGPEDVAGKRGLLSPLGGRPGVRALEGGAGERDTSRAAGHRQLLRVLLDRPEQPRPQRRLPVVRRLVGTFYINIIGFIKLL